MKKFFSRPFLPVASAVCLFFLVLGAHWAAVDKFGSDMPNWDQWDAEGLNTLAPWFEHDHFLSHLFQPHNEHRVVVTKLHNLALALLDGQWDARLESVTNAALHAALAVAFWLAGWHWLRCAEAGAGRREAGGASQPWQRSSPLRPPPTSGLQPFREASLFVVLAALFALPVAWQNVLGGFHSQQYWLLLLSFAAIVALPFARPWSAGWWAAAGATALALLTMGSGFFAAAMVFCVGFFRLMRRETTLRAAWPTLVFTLALVVVGLLTRIEVAGHQALKAKTASDFFLSILHSLQWPAPRAYPWLAAVLWLPWLLVAWRVVTFSPTCVNTVGGAAPPPRIVPPDRGEGAAAPAQAVHRPPLAIVLLGGWVLAQIVATAYARGVGGDYPASRYMDTLVFGIAANALALGWLLQRPETKDQRPETEEIFPDANRRPQVSGLWSLVSGPWSLVPSLLWLGVVAWGVYDLAHLAIGVEMPDEKRFYVEAEAHLRGFLATNDPAQLAFDDIPFPDAGSLIARLSHPSLRALMPVSIRPPLVLAPAAANETFVENNASQLLLDTAPHRGLGPRTAPLASLPTWGSFGPGGVAKTGEWTSAPLTAPLGGWLKFETAGDIGRDGVALELRDAKNNALLATIAPTKIPGDTWRAAYVRAPREPFVVVARDESASRWLAFSAPVELGTLSCLALCCVKNGLLVAGLATGAAVLLGVARLASRRKL